MQNLPTSPWVGQNSPWTRQHIMSSERDEYYALPNEGSLIALYQSAGLVMVDIHQSTGIMTFARQRT
ncbi:MAG: hypothetical protein FWC83_01545 [Alphaproteobacteria bacterium]|nr:hypothetical protein [Alphaproteobacteria bacterium]